MSDHGSDIGSEKPAETTMEDLQLKMIELEKRFLGTSFHDSPTPFAPRSTIESKIAKISKKHEDSEQKASQKTIQSKKFPPNCPW